MKRFGLRTLFIVVLLSSIGVLAFNEHRRALPPSQTPYSATELQRQLLSGKPVLVTIDAAWAIKPTDRPRYMSADVARRVRSTNLVALTADWTDKSPAVDALMASLNQSKLPALALYSPSDPSNPIVLSGNTSDSQILGAIDAVLEK